MNLLTITQVSNPGAAMPPSMTAAGIGVAVMVSQDLQAYCGRMWRCTKKRAGSTASLFDGSSPVLTRS